MELLNDAIMPDGSFVRTQGDLVRFSVAQTAALQEANERFGILREHRAACIKAANIED